MADGALSRLNGDGSQRGCSAISLPNPSQTAIIKGMKQPYVYIMASDYNGTLYVGMTANLKARVWSHKNRRNIKSFSSRYHVVNLVYYEALATIPEAIARENALKNLNRAGKIELIEKNNPEWLDLPLD